MKILQYNYTSMMFLPEIQCIIDYYLKWDAIKERLKVRYYLRPGYLNSEITQFEQKYNCVLPNDIKSYLLIVSRDIFIRLNTYTFTLDNAGLLYDCKIPYERCNWHIGNCTHCNTILDPMTRSEQENSSIECKSSCQKQHMYEGMLILLSTRRSIQYYMPIKGTHVGSLWFKHDNESSFKLKYLSLMDCISKWLNDESLMNHDNIYKQYNYYSMYPKYTELHDFEG